MAKKKKFVIYKNTVLKIVPEHSYTSCRGCFFDDAKGHRCRKSRLVVETYDHLCNTDGTIYKKVGKLVKLRK